MANVIIVVGDTGSGKSTSVATLNPKETFIINTLNKPLPFKGSKTNYSVENKNVYSTDNYAKVIAAIGKVDKDRPEIKNLILDDIGFVMLGEFFEKAGEKGYDKFAHMGQHMQQIINTAKNCRDDLNVVMMFHEDDDVSDRIKVGKKVKLIGMMLEDKYNPLAIVTICLFTNVNFNEKTGEAEYTFITQRCKVEGLLIPAKTPQGMFDSVRIPNDLSLVLNKVKEYYN